MKIVQFMDGAMYEVCDEDAEVLRDFVREAIDVHAIKHRSDRAMVVVDALLSVVSDLHGVSEDRWTRLRAAGRFAASTYSPKDVIRLE